MIPLQILTSMIQASVCRNLTTTNAMKKYTAGAVKALPVKATPVKAPPVEAPPVKAPPV